MPACGAARPGSGRPGRGLRSLPGTGRDGRAGFFLNPRLAGRAVPLSADDTDALRLLAQWCVDGEQPAKIHTGPGRNTQTDLYWGKA